MKCGWTPHSKKNPALYPNGFAHSQSKWPKYPCVS